MLPTEEAFLVLIFPVGFFRHIVLLSHFFPRLNVTIYEWKRVVEWMFANPDQYLTLKPLFGVAYAEHQTQTRTADSLNWCLAMPLGWL